MATIPAPVTCPVINETSVFAARSMVRPIAAAIGFDREVIEELVLVVSELASNIVKYGRRGRIELAPLGAESGRGISIVAEDETPPFDLLGSLRDGYDAKGKIDPALVFGRRGIAAGLGAVSRMSDSLELVPHGSGKRVVAKRLVGPPRRGSRPSF